MKCVILRAAKRMEGLKLLNGVFTAAFDTRGGLPNVINREIRLGFLTDEADIYDEWVLHCVESELAVRCICGMQAQVNRSVILKSVKSDVRIYVGSTCLENFPRVDPSVFSETVDGYSREDDFVIDDDSDCTIEISESESSEDDDDVDADDEEHVASVVPKTYNLRKRSFGKKENDAEQQPRKRPCLNSKKTVDAEANAFQTIVFDSCVDYFSRKTHTQMEQTVFVGFLQSLFANMK